MLRDNTEQFAPDFKFILEQLGVFEEADEGFQLLKFERAAPDVFVWLLRGSRPFLVSIARTPADHVDEEWLSKWLNDYDTENIILLDDADGESLVSDDFDSIQVYVLPDDYELDDQVHV